MVRLPSGITFSAKPTLVEAVIVLVQWVAGSWRRCWLDSSMRTQRPFVRAARNCALRKHLVNCLPPETPSIGGTDCGTESFLPPRTSKDLGGRPPLASRCISLTWLFFHGDAHSGRAHIRNVIPLSLRFRFLDQN